MNTWLIITIICTVLLAAHNTMWVEIAEYWRRRYKDEFERRHRYETR